MHKSRSDSPPVDGREAQQKRRALKAFMVDHDLTPAGWSRDAGLRNANSLYNFLNGLSQSLASTTLERLAKAAGASIDDLLGLGSPPTEMMYFPAVMLTGIVCKGHWAKTFHRPSANRGSEPIPVPPGIDAHLALTVMDDHAVAFNIPRGASVLVADFSMTQMALSYGDLVVVKRIKAGRIETTVRRVVKPMPAAAGEDATALLLLGEEAADGRQSLSLPTWPYRSDTGPFSVGEDRYEIAGQVTHASFTPAG